jgi:ketosteroid isomerase-like protein
MKKLLTFAATCCLFYSCNNEKPVETAANASDSLKSRTETTAPKDVEFADTKYMEMGKTALAAMAKGDINGFLGNYADNAVYAWSSGDSLVGLPAISKYWTERRTKVIDSIHFANDIWLAIKVNKPQRGPDLPGIWLMGWYQFMSKYKNGKTVGGWIHQDMHFNSDGKIDRTVQYIDRAPINKALGK